MHSPSALKAWQKSIYIVDKVYMIEIFNCKMFLYICECKNIYMRMRIVQHLHEVQKQGKGYYNG